MKTKTVKIEREKRKANVKAIQAFRNIVQGLPSAVRRLAAEQVQLVKDELGDEDQDLAAPLKPDVSSY